MPPIQRSPPHPPATESPLVSCHHCSPADRPVVLLRAPQQTPTPESAERKIRRPYQKVIRKRQSPPTQLQKRFPTNKDQPADCATDPERVHLPQLTQRQPTQL